MKRTVIPWFVTLALVWCGLAAPSLAKSNDVAQIKALEQNFQEAFLAKDVAAIMKCYAPGDQLFVFDVVPPRQYAGFDAYKKDWEDTFTTFDGTVTFELTDLVITTDGHGLAYGHSIQHVTGKLKTGEPVDADSARNRCVQEDRGQVADRSRARLGPGRFEYRQTRSAIQAVARSETGSVRRA